MRFYNRLLIITVVSLLFTECKKFVKIASPTTQIVTANVFNNTANATSAITGIYAQMILSRNNYPWTYYISYYTGLYGDELMNYSTVPSIQQIYQDNIDAIGSPTNNLWTDAYNFIYQANAAIEGLQNTYNISLPIKEQLTSEAKFIRAYWYLYLTNLYGEIPITLTTDYSINRIESRSSQENVYKQIIADLEYASNHLKPYYINKTDTASTADRSRPNAYSADALLARVFLYDKKYDSAEIEATKVIDANTLYDTVPINSVFLINSKETIWQLNSSGTSFKNSFEGYYYILTGAPLTNTTNSSAISSSLLSSFEGGDLRKSNWIGSYTDNSVVPAKTYYFPFKYKLGATSSSPQECSVVLRLSEQYLIRAESRAELGDLSGAQKDLNIVRHRAGLSNSTANTKGALLAAILDERRVELFCEYGLRWFDLKRTGRVNTLMQQVAHEKGGTWNNNKVLWPIPQSELRNDPNLIQNQGY